MKIVPRSEIQFEQSVGHTTKETYSLSGMVSTLLGSRQLFVHQDILAPGKRSSAPHRHTVIEEIVHVVKGSATAVCGDASLIASEGSFIFFDPKDRGLHFIINNSNADLETVTYSIDSDFDQAVFDSEPKNGISLPEFHFDQDLKDIPKKPEEFEAFVSELKMKLKSAKNAETRLQLLEHLGIASRMLGRLAEAEAFLLQALSLSYAHPQSSRVFQNLIRLAHVYQWKKDFLKAELLFSQASSLKDINSFSEILLAAFQQHLGKFYFDQGSYRKALAEFKTSLELRKKINAPMDQIESSQLAIQVSEARLELKT